MVTLFSSCSVRPLVCEDIQADMEDGQLQFFYILAFVLQGDASSHSSVMHISRLCVMTCVDIMNHMSSSSEYKSVLSSFKSGEKKLDHKHSAGRKPRANATIKALIIFLQP